MTELQAQSNVLATVNNKDLLTHICSRKQQMGARTHAQKIAAFLVTPVQQRIKNLFCRSMNILKFLFDIQPTPLLHQFSDEKSMIGVHV